MPIESNPSHAEPGIALESLTGRELRILKLLDLGLSNQEISDRLGISVGTAKWHLRHLFQKLQVPSRAQAVTTARERGLV